MDGTGGLKFKFNRTQIYADNRRNKKDAMRIAPSAKRLSVYIRVPKGISYTTFSEEGGAWKSQHFYFLNVLAFFFCAETKIYSCSDEKGVHPT